MAEKESLSMDEGTMVFDDSGNTLTAMCPLCGKELKFVRHPQRQGRMVGTCSCHDGPVLEIDVPKAVSVRDTEERETLLLEDVDGIGREIALACFRVGIQTMDDVRELSDEALLMIPGIGKQTLKKLREACDA